MSKYFEFSSGSLGIFLLILFVTLSHSLNINNENLNSLEETEESSTFDSNFQDEILDSNLTLAASSTEITTARNEEIGTNIETQIKQNIQLKSESYENSVLEFNEKHLDGVTVNYPEVVPGRPVTAYLIVGIIFVILTLSPYVIYGLYVIIVPEFIRKPIGEKFRSARDVDHLQFQNEEYGQVLHDRSECIEKIICRLSKRAHQFGMGDWMGMDGSVLEHIPSLSTNWKYRLFRGMRTGSLRGQCSQFNCDPMARLGIARLWGDWRKRQEASQGSQGTNPSIPYDENSIHEKNKYL